jgi:hypothetical protein
VNIIYCEPRSALFALGRKKMPTAMPTEKARRRHERRQGYEAVIGEPEHPQYVVCLYPNVASTKTDSISRCMEGNGDWVSVYFLDASLRWYLEYGFQEKQPGKLFLTHTLFREFVGDTDKVQGAKTFAFKEDGYIFMEDQNLLTGSVEEREVRFSVEENWEDYPSFGEYQRL